ncbi:benzoate/H(+) symporter BenE family transporter [Mycobacterium montefiorense]|uniref:Benzoate transporter n=1 Tax=Mycobacterium montefiorense TaxID=154654 RepID=A0AA37USV4_9MYCO|nr:benzoate/H(+) symporter BenE family transporter [Mycobacterium montefiorense]GBG36007.1 benzoate transporter [Mycobacterium montefiorense]GKU34007.1 benzoate transporter [Mycobacterium montefiorense]GKU41405.1 benzoate transporter [Mycobacterium montefiorense]GKU47503.1 benzoate transporter [Mycobacterium montefiorense]GKU52301.1 benzoate transporter [Mycobacterium montefiorense]
MELRQPIHAGLSIALVGYTSAFAVVIAGLQAVGATPKQATSGLAVLCVTIGLGTLWLSLRHRIPITLAWSTPGAAVLVSTGVVHGGWPAAVGAFLLTGALVLLTGVWPRMGALITAIPAPIAQAMLAGVVLQLCLTPVRGLASHPWQVTPILLTWLVFARFATRWAVPAAFVVTLTVIGLTHHAGLSGPVLPQPVWTTPQLNWAAVVGVTLPLYIVTMAAQNVPGVAIMGSYGYQVPWRESMTVTGLGTLAGAAFGGHAINLAAISAAVPASPEAHRDPARRWPAATAFGAGYLVLAALTTALTTLVAGAPPEVIGAVAGLGLLSTLGSSLAVATSGPVDLAGRAPAAITFVVAVSGVSLAGISAAFWALAAGLVVQAALRPTRNLNAENTSPRPAEAENAALGVND